MLVALAVTAAAGAVVFGSSPAAAGPGEGESSGPAEVSNEQHHDRSRPLRETPSKPWNNETWVREHPAISPAGATTPRSDGALQASAAATSAPATAGVGVAGIGNGDYGFAVQYAPPDTTGAVGDTQYVQWVNTSLAVFNKSDGSLVAGFPKYGNTLFTGFGGGCEVNNDGDPVVQYDKIAQRWVLTQFSVSSPSVYGYLQCVAVSQTSDATGAYNRYSFSYGATAFNDYPKLGVWPDAYYISYNIFTNGSSFAGSKVCALDRAKMLAGTAATQQCFQTTTAYGGLLPSDLDGSSPPPANAPNVFAAFGANRLDLWKFHVDWANPANTTFSGTPTPLGVAAFSEACAGGACIPQPGTSQQLDSLADRLMYRLAYRNFGDHESWVVTHSVTAGSSVGVRWYELRGLSGTPSVFQQGTYAPDAAARWMGSAAMDRNGDIAVGYSVSSSSRYPSVAYATWAVGDPPNTLSAEVVAKAGTGSQTTRLSRWGDYSTMTVDPVDDCTFWYSTEYLKGNGTFNWSTWIASFRLPSCTTTPAAPGAPTLLSATPGNNSVALSWTVPSGSPTSYTVNRTPAPTSPFTGISGTTFTDTTAVNGTLYTYTVTATNSVGVGPASNELSATPQAPPVPPTPAGLTATAGNTQVTLSWSPVTGTVTGYRVYRRTGTGPVAQVATTTSAGYTDPGLTNGTTYSYSVTAYNTSGESPPSSEVPATPSAPATVPGAPSLTASTSPTRGVALSWSAPAANGSAITTYTLYRSRSPGGEVAYATLSCTGTSCLYTDPNTKSGRLYYYQLSATNAVGTGPRSNEASATAR